LPGDLRHEVPSSKCKVQSSKFKVHRRPSNFELFFELGTLNFEL
jgi:hypothetical protein